jgi:hypothetical protein
MRSLIRWAAERVEYFRYKRRLRKQIKAVKMADGNIYPLWRTHEPERLAPTFNHSAGRKPH